jgi:peptidoglycan/xylan/chitin deacetylase (PgdA/CDA1 family)
MTLTRFIKLSISMLCRAAQRARGRSARVVLYFHAVTDEQAARFRRQMEWLRHYSRVIPLSQIESSPAGRPAVAVTFDDAFDCVRRNALPVLEALRIPATIFAVSGNLGRAPAWHMVEDDSDSAETVMTAEQLRSLPADLIGIGSHTVTHPMLSRLAPADVRREAIESKRDLEAIVGHAVADFSFPYGDYSDSAVAAVADAGYRRIFTSDPFVVTGGERVMGRFAASPDDWPIEFRLKAVGAYGWLRHVRRFKRAILRLPRRGAPHVPAVTHA